MRRHDSLDEARVSRSSGHLPSSRHGRHPVHSVTVAPELGHGPCTLPDRTDSTHCTCRRGPGYPPTVNSRSGETGRQGREPLERQTQPRQNPTGVWDPTLRSLRSRSARSETVGTGDWEPRTKGVRPRRRGRVARSSSTLRVRSATVARRRVSTRGTSTTVSRCCTRDSRTVAGWTRVRVYRDGRGCGRGRRRRAGTSSGTRCGRWTGSGGSGVRSPGGGSRGPSTLVTSRPVPPVSVEYTSRYGRSVSATPPRTPGGPTGLTLSSFPPTLPPRHDPDPESVRTGRDTG